MYNDHATQAPPSISPQLRDQSEKVQQSCTDGLRAPPADDRHGGGQSNEAAFPCRLKIFLRTALSVFETPSHT